MEEEGRQGGREEGKGGIGAQGGKIKVEVWDGGIERKLKRGRREAGMRMGRKESVCISRWRWKRKENNRQGE